jgi:dihydroxyacetone kinase
MPVISAPRLSFSEHGLAGSTPASGVAGRALAAGIGRVKRTRTLEIFRCARVFREGAKNCARGGRAPQTNCMVPAKSRFLDFQDLRRSAETPLHGFVQNA